MKVKPTKFKGVFKIDERLATINLVPGFRSANEELVRVGDKEYRIWDPYTSKPSAAIKKGISVFPLERGQRVLYLGFASGKTASYFSDLIGREGLLFGVEISERVLREAFPMVEKRGNLIPVLGDARKPTSYKPLILGKVDFLYEDVASEDQIRILIENAKFFLKPGGYAAIAIKSQSISSTRPSSEVYSQCLEELRKHFKILDKVELDPFEKLHLFVVLRRQLGR